MKLTLELAQALLAKRRSDHAFLTRAYEIAFRRQPDEGGERDFLLRMERGTSRLIVLEQLMTSAEYDATGRSHEDFARDLYRLVLEREPEPGDGVKSWSAYAGVNGRAAAFRLFCQSDEVQVKYLKDDAYDLVEGAAGLLRVTLRRSDAQVVFGPLPADQPLSVNRDTFPQIRPVLEIAGFKSLTERLADHIATAAPPVQAP